MSYCPWLLGNFSAKDYVHESTPHFQRNDAKIEKRGIIIVNALHPSQQHSVTVLDLFSLNYCYSKNPLIKILVMISVFTEHSIDTF